MEDVLEHRKEVQNNILKSFGAISHENEFEKAHQDGDMHPNGKWVWRSSANGGKGDWRVASKDNATVTNKAKTSKTSKQVVEAQGHKFDAEDDPYVKRGNKTLSWYKLSVVVDGIRVNGEANEFWDSNKKSDEKIGGYEIVINGYKNDMNIAKEGKEPKTLEEAKSFFLSAAKKIFGK